MVTLRWPRFSNSYWPGGGSGEKVPRFQEDWLSHRVPQHGGTEGQGEYRSSVAVFPSNQRPSFPSQGNLGNKCPT